MLVNTWIKWCMVGLFLVCQQAAGTSPAQAQEKYPSRPIDFIVAFGAGGGSDSMSRRLGSILEGEMGVAFPVSNFPGADGNTGMTKMLSSRADGYTIGVYSGSIFGTKLSGTSPHTVDDFAWISRLMLVPTFFFVHSKDTRFQNMKEVLAFAKANPGKLKVATTGFGGLDELSLRFLKLNGYTFTNVPYPKSSLRYASLAGRHVDVLIEQAGDVAGFLESGDFTPIVIWSEKRHARYPNVPTSFEAGFPLAMANWRAIVAKKGTPGDRANALSNAINKATQSAKWQKYCKKKDCDPDSFLGPAEFEKWIRKQFKAQRALMVKVGLTK